MGDNIISVSNVKKIYKINRRTNGFWSNIANVFIPQYDIKKAIDDISFEIKEGEMVAFIGANGAGKSTMIKMLSGILYPDSGNIIINGLNPYSDRKKYVSNIGVVFGQKSQLAWDLPVIESYELIKHIYRISENKYMDNLEKYIDLLDMKSFVEQPVRQLSLGQRMRADIAASLLHSPQIIFFDEPTIGLDVLAKEKIRNFLVKLNMERNITMIFTTHDMQDIEKICNRIIMIDKGKKIYDGTIVELLAQYGNRRKLIITFNGKIPLDLKIDNVVIDIDEAKKNTLIFEFDSNTVNIKDIFEVITRDYSISDISVTDMNIEMVVRNFYERLTIKNKV